MFVNDGAAQNSHGKLEGQPVSTYRAEPQGAVQAILSARTPICIVCDNLAVVEQLKNILSTGRQEANWPGDDGCDLFRRLIADKGKLREPGHHTAMWMASHMDDPKKATAKATFLC